MKKYNRRILLIMLNANGWRNPKIFGGGEVQTMNTISQIGEFQWTVIIPRQMEKLASGFKQDQIRYIFLDRTFKKTNAFLDIIQGLVYAIQAVAAGWRRRNEFDLVYSSTTNFSDILPAKITALLSGKPLAVKYHISLYSSNRFSQIYKGFRSEKNGVFDSFLRAFLARLTLWMMANAWVMTVSKFLADQLVTCGIKKDRLAVNYNGIDFEKLEKLRDKNISKKYEVCFLGRVEECKGIIDFIELVDRLRKINGQVNAIIIGDGSSMGKAKRLIIEKGLENNITITGFLGEERYSILQQAKLLISPTFANEGFGLVLMEAAFLGVPAVAYNQPVFKEVFEDFSGVHLIPSGIEGLATKTTSLLFDQESWDVAHDPVLFADYSIAKCQKREQAFLSQVK